MAVSIEITHGTWSEVVIARGAAIVFGKFSVQAREEKKKTNPVSEAGEYFSCCSKYIFFP
jgi:hypothetical protein